MSPDTGAYYSTYFDEGIVKSGIERAHIDVTIEKNGPDKLPHDFGL